MIVRYATCFTADVLAARKPLRVEIVHAPVDGSDAWGSLDPAGGSG